MIALHHYYAGKGNASCRVAEADQINKTLMYKYERTMFYETFLDNFQKMCTIFEEEK